MDSNTVISLAEISQYLWNAEIPKQNQFFNGTIDPSKSQQLYLARKALQYGVDQNLSGLPGLTNYVYGLCGAQLAIAEEILYGGSIGGNVIAGGSGSFLSLTTNGTSGVATLVGSVLNIPNYTSDLSNYLPLTGGTLTGDLSINKTSGKATLFFPNTGSQNDPAFIQHEETTIDNSILRFSVSDNNTADYFVFGNTGGGLGSFSERFKILSNGTVTLGTWNGSSIADAYISSASTWNAKQNAITLTTIGTSGAATFVGSTLNIPNYTNSGLTSLNNLTSQVQFLATGTSGTDFNISSATDTHTFNLPVASALNTGKLSSTDWTTFNNKLSSATAAATYVSGDGTPTYIPVFTANRQIGNSMITQIKAPTIGQSYEGGRVAYILQPSDSGYDANYTKGFIVSNTDLTPAQWGCRGTVFGGAYDYAIGKGQENTTAILAGCATAGIAARLCNDYSNDGYSDWYLPSYDELVKIYQNRVAINLTFSSENEGFYWSSTNIDNTPFPEQLANVYSLTAGTGGPYFKDFVVNVRAIRSFTTNTEIAITADVNLGTNRISSNGADFRSIGSNNGVGLVLTSEYNVLSNPKTIYTSYGESTALGGHEFRSVNGPGFGTITSLYLAPSGAATFLSNIGIGSPVSAWGVNWRPLQMGSYGSFITGRTDDNSMVIGKNSFFDGTNWIGTTTGWSQQMFFDSSGNTIFRSANATISNTISFVESLRIQSDGVLKLSTTASIPSDNNTIFSYSTNGYFYIQGGATGLALAGSGNRNNAIYVNTTLNQINFATNDGLTKMQLNSAGDLNIGTLGTGIVYSNAGTLTSTNPSDSRLKINIQNVSRGLSDILKLRPVSFIWKDDKINQGIQFGFIAQEVQQVMPEAIKEFGDDITYLGIEKDAIYTTLVKAIQEQNQIIKNLETRIQSLESK